MAVNSRNKGADGERELAGLIRDHLGVRMVRNLVQSRDGGCDLVVSPDQGGPVAETLGQFAIEVKRYARPTPALVSRWWRQAEEQARATGKTPALAYRGNREPWRVVLPLSALVDSIEDDGYPFTVSMGLEGFCSYLRETGDTT